METENNKTIELKLSQSEFSDAMVCNDQNLIHKVQMNQILEIVDAQFQKAITRLKEMISRAEID